MSADPQPARMVPPSRRRDKPILSCTLCRRRKLKCDRHSPCQTCVERGLSLSCTYVHNPVTPQEPKASSGVHNRIDQLEKLVTRLMSDKEVAHDSPALSASSYPEQNSDDPEDAGTPDRMRLGNDTTRYTNSSHWTSILDGISELREHLDDIPTSAHSKDADQGEILGPDLLFGRQRHVSKQELLGALPPRAEADQLIDTCFNSMRATPAPAFLHVPTFLIEYNDFWQQPFDVPTMWLGLLFSVLALGARFRSESEVRSANAESDPRQLLLSAQTDFYREKIVQCLVLAKYTQCPPHTMETLLFYFATETLRSTDTQFSMWILVGMIVRMAFRMGYHREPSRFPDISPFRAEIRRRTWLIVVSIDLVTSSQVGLPRMVQPFMYDTREPGNYLEADLHEYLTELPPPRPEPEVTSILYTLMQTRLMATYAKIMDLVNINSQPPYRDIMALDAGLRQVYNKIPPLIRPIAAEEFELTVTQTTIRRLYVCLAFSKANLVLHRPYLLLGRTDFRYEYSRRTCLSAALEMMTFHNMIHNNFVLGGCFSPIAGKYLSEGFHSSPILNHDFLLATTVLILDLDRDIVSPARPLVEPTTKEFPIDLRLPNRETIIKSLQTSYRNWARMSTRSHDAKRVVAAIRVVLRKVNTGPQEETDQPNEAMNFDHSVTPESTFGFNDFSAQAPNPALFNMEVGNYTDPFIMDITSMDAGGFSSTFNWDDMASEFFPCPGGELPGNPPFG